LGTQTFTIDRIDLAEVPVLTVETIYGATGVKYGQIVMTGLMVSGTNPIGNAIGGQWISVPMEYTPRWRAGQML